MFFCNSTLTTSSGLSSGLCPVSLVVSLPSSIIIVFVTHFLKAKSKDCTLIFSISWSSSPSIHLSGVESISSIPPPFSSELSVICALLIIILSDVFGITTLSF